MHDPLFSCAQIVQEMYRTADQEGDDRLRAFALRLGVALSDVRKKLIESGVEEIG